MEREVTIIGWAEILSVSNDPTQTTFSHVIQHQSFITQNSTNDEKHTICQCIIKGNLHFVSNGSYYEDEQPGAAAWVIEREDN